MFSDDVVLVCNVPWMGFHRLRPRLWWYLERGEWPMRDKCAGCDSDDSAVDASPNCETTRTKGQNQYFGAGHRA